MKYVKFHRFFIVVFLFIAFVPRALGLPWNEYNDPEKFEKIFPINYFLDQLPKSAFIETPPWSETYWPTNQGSINYRWNASDPSGFNYIPYTKNEVFKLGFDLMKQLSPSEKYDLFMGRYDYPLFNEVKQYGNPRAKDWSGICDGWSIAASQFYEPTPITLVNGDGLVIPFGSSDVKALMSFFAAKHFNPKTIQVGLSCKWWSRNGACQDINPGSLHVIIGNLLGIQRKTFISEIYSGYEIWNQPTFGYEFKILEEVPLSNGSKITKVRTMLYYTNELEKSLWEPVTGTDQFKFEKITLEYTLETDENGKIIGGKWIQGSEKIDFIWLPTARLEFKGYDSGINKIYRPAL